MINKSLPIAQWFWRTSKGLRLQALLNTILGILQVLFDFAFISATKRIIDIATRHLTHHTFLDSLLPSTLQWAALMLVGIMCCRILIGFGRRWMTSLLEVKSQNKMQIRLFRHLMHSTWNGLEAQHSGDILNRLERDVKDISSVITETVPDLFSVCFRFGGAFLFLCTMDTRLACILLCIAPLFVLLSKLYVRKMKKITKEIRTTDSVIQSILQESIQHRVLLKTLEQGDYVANKLSQTQNRLRELVRHRTLFASCSGVLLNIGFGAGYLVTFLWGANRLYENTISYGTMLAFIQLVGQIQGPIREITRFIPILVGSLTACERLIEIESTPLEENSDTQMFTHEVGIRLKDITFSYEEGARFVLHHFSYDFPPGSSTAIWGETGAGKTTLIRLILALLHPQEGSIELYDNEHSIPVAPSTRCNLVYVPQGNTLLSGTIRENLLLGDPQATEEKMWEVLRTCCAEFVGSLPQGLDSRCGELGAGLSEGQSQRICIARALLRKGHILLLDEATSALDIETEQRLLKNLTATSEPTRTMLWITHRPAVAEYCHQTLKVVRSQSTVSP